MDFNTLEIVDILPNRWEETTNAYFLSIPLEERKNVKYLINNDVNSTSSKNLAAKKLEIPILSEQDFVKKFLT